MDIIKKISRIQLLALLMIAGCQPSNNSRQSTDSIFNSQMKSLLQDHEFPLERKMYFQNITDFTTIFKNVKTIKNCTFDYTLALKQYTPSGEFTVSVVHAYNDSLSVVVPFNDAYWYRMNACINAPISDNLIFEKYFNVSISQFRPKKRDIREITGLPFEYNFITDFMLLMKFYDRLNVSDSIKITALMDFDYKFNNKADNCHLIQERSKVQILDNWKKSIEDNQIIFGDIDLYNMYYICKGTPLIFHFTYNNLDDGANVRINTFNGECTCHMAF